MWISGRRVSPILFAVLMVMPPLGGLEATLGARAAGAAVTNYGGTGTIRPYDITSGPDGALWFTNEVTDSIGRVSTSGTVTNYTDPSIDTPQGITAGSDGALWFTNEFSDSIGRITTTGTVTNYTDPILESSYPYDITAGPDGALWFTTQNPFNHGSIGRITTTGTVTVFTDPGISSPVGITAGPDGALWFTNQGDNSIGRITTTGTVTKYTDPSISDPLHIAAGPDGALWFTNFTGDSIGRITTTGTVTHHTGTGISAPYFISAGPDGAMWFTNHDRANNVFASLSNSIGRITTAGTVSHYADPTISSPYGIAAGSDGAVWFTNYASNSIGRITVSTQPSIFPGTPRSVSAVPLGNGTAYVTWHAPVNNGAPITSYVVTPYLGTVAQRPVLFNSRATAARVTGLQNGKAYRFTIAARNAVDIGPSSLKTAPISVGAPGRPGKPTAVKVGSGSLKISFRAPGNGGAPITSYAATCASSNHGATHSKTGRASPITVAGLTHGKTYTCRVKATNGRGTGPPSTPSAAVRA